MHSALQPPRVGGARGARDRAHTRAVGRLRTRDEIGIMMSELDGDRGLKVLRDQTMLAQAVTYDSFNYAKSRQLLPADQSTQQQSVLMNQMNDRIFGKSAVDGGGHRLNVEAMNSDQLWEHFGVVEEFATHLGKTTFPSVGLNYEQSHNIGKMLGEVVKVDEMLDIFAHQTNDFIKRSYTQFHETLIPTDRIKEIYENPDWDKESVYESVRGGGMGPKNQFLTDYTSQKYIQEYRTNMQQMFGEDPDDINPVIPGVDSDTNALVNPAVYDFSTRVDSSLSNINRLISGGSKLLQRQGFKNAAQRKGYGSLEFNDSDPPPLDLINARDTDTRIMEDVDDSLRDPEIMLDVNRTREFHNFLSTQGGIQSGYSKNIHGLLLAEQLIDSIGDPRVRREAFTQLALQSDDTNDRSMQTLRNLVRATGNNIARGILLSDKPEMAEVREHAIIAGMMQPEEAMNGGKFIPVGYTDRMAEAASKLDMIENELIFLTKGQGEYTKRLYSSEAYNESINQVDWRERPTILKMGQQTNLYPGLMYAQGIGAELGKITMAYKSIPAGVSGGNSTIANSISQAEQNLSVVDQMRQQFQQNDLVIRSQLSNRSLVGPNVEPTSTAAQEVNAGLAMNAHGTFKYMNGDALRYQSSQSSMQQRASEISEEMANTFSGHQQQNIGPHSFDPDGRSESNAHGFSYPQGSIYTSRSNNYQASTHNYQSQLHTINEDSEFSEPVTGRQNINNDPGTAFNVDAKHPSNNPSHGSFPGTQQQQQTSRWNDIANLQSLGSNDNNPLDSQALYERIMDENYRQTRDVEFLSVNRDSMLRHIHEEQVLDEQRKSTLTQLESLVLGNMALFKSNGGLFSPDMNDKDKAVMLNEMVSNAGAKIKEDRDMLAGLQETIGKAKNLETKATSLYSTQAAEYDKMAKEMNQLRERSGLPAESMMAFSQYTPQQKAQWLQQGAEKLQIHYNKNFIGPLDKVEGLMSKIGDYNIRAEDQLRDYEKLRFKIINDPRVTRSVDPQLLANATTPQDYTTILEALATTKKAAAAEQEAIAKSLVSIWDDVKPYIDEEHKLQVSMRATISDVVMKLQRANYTLGPNVMNLVNTIKTDQQDPVAFQKTAHSIAQELQEQSKAQRGIVNEMNDAQRELLSLKTNIDELDNITRIMNNSQKVNLQAIELKVENIAGRHPAFVNGFPSVTNPEDPTQLKHFAYAVRQRVNEVHDSRSELETAVKSLSTVLAEVSILSKEYRGVEKERDQIVASIGQAIAQIDYAGKKRINTLSTITQIQEQRGALEEARAGIAGECQQLAQEANRIELEVSRYKAEKMITDDKKRAIERMEKDRETVLLQLQASNAYIREKQSRIDQAEALSLVYQEKSQETREKMIADLDSESRKYVTAFDSIASQRDLIKSYLPKISDKDTQNILQFALSPATNNLVTDLFGRMRMSDRIASDTPQLKGIASNMKDLTEQLLGEKMNLQTQIALLTDDKIERLASSEQTAKLEDRWNQIKQLREVNFALSAVNTQYGKLSELEDKVFISKARGDQARNRIISSFDDTTQTGLGTAYNRLITNVDTQLKQLTQRGTQSVETLQQVTRYLKNDFTQDITRVDTALNSVIASDDYNRLASALWLDVNQYSHTINKLLEEHKANNVISESLEESKRQGIHGLTQSLTNIMLTLGGRLYHGLDPSHGIAEQTLQIARAFKDNNMAGTLSDETLENVARDTIASLSASMKPEILNRLVDKIPATLHNTLQEFDSTIFGRLVHANGDPNLTSNILASSNYKSPQYEVYQKLRLSATSRIPLFMETVDKVQPQLLSDFAFLEGRHGPLPSAPEPSLARVKETMAETVQRQFKDDAPLLGSSLLGKRNANGDSLYNHPMAIASMRAQRVAIDQSGPGQLEARKHELKKHRDFMTTQEANVRLRDPALWSDENFRLTAGEMTHSIAHEILPMYIADQATAGYMMKKELDWNLEDKVRYSIDVVRHTPQILANMQAVVKIDMENLVPISSQHQLKYNALSEILAEAAVTVQNIPTSLSARYQPGNIPDGIMRDHNQLAPHLGAYQRQLKTSIENFNQEINLYNTQYMNDQFEMLDILDDYVVQTEAKQQQWGKVNAVMETQAKQIEGAWLGRLREMGLTQIVDPTQMAAQRQNLMMASQGIRHATQVMPQAYQRTNQGLSSKQMAYGQQLPPTTMGEYRQAKANGTLSGQDDPRAPDGGSAAGRGEGETRVRREAIAKLRQVSNIGKADVNFLKRLKVNKKTKRMTITEDEEGKGADRELTDEEKVRASRLIVSMTILMYAQTMKGLSKRELEATKKKLESQAGDEKGAAQLVEALNGMVDKVERRVPSK